MQRCQHCSGPIVAEFERDSVGWVSLGKCLSCSRQLQPPRPHEEPVDDAEVVTEDAAA
jgi:hypothetical protein